MKKILTLAAFFACMTCGTLAQIISAEYFFDADPGQGNGIPVVLASPGDTVTQQVSIPISGLSVGPHLLCMRVKNANGIWSHQVSRSFYITASFPSQQITAAEYFFDTDPGPGNGMSLAVPSGDSLIAQPAIVNPLATGTHYLAIRTRDAGGQWSLQAADTFRVCSSYGAKSEFEFFIDRKTVYFTNNSIYDTAFSWNFSHGAPDTVQRNPAHVYPLAGIYNVCLTATNSCATETHCRLVAIKGIQSITPSFSADSNLCPSEVRGIGFRPGAFVYLIKSGSPTLAPDTVIFIDSTRLKTLFRFNHAATGTYDVVLTNPTLPNDTLKNGFRIETTNNRGPSSSFNGWPRMRPYRSTVITYSVTNNSNRTLYMIPVTLLIRMDSLITFTVLSSIFIEPSVPPSILAYRNPDGSYTIPDPANPQGPPVRLLSLMVPVLGPGQSQSLDLRFSNTTALVRCATIKAKVGNPLDGHIVNPVSSSCNFLPNVVKCMMDLGGLIPGVGCVTGAANFGCSIGNTLNGLFFDPNLRNSLHWYDIPVNFGGMLVSCVPNGWTTYKKLEYATSAFSDLFNGIGAMSDCGNAAVDFLNWDPYELGPKQFSVCVSNSYDPNDKSGPEGITLDNYINRNATLPFTIRFENVDTATAPAAEVEIIDTLDKFRFDFSSFRFTQFGLADTVFTLPEEFSLGFVRDFDLRNSHSVILRVNASFDSLSGIIRYVFSSLDTISMDLVTDPLLGFLPPNDSAPEGQGFIRYDVKPLPGLQHGDVLANRASIRFDVNQALLTNTWINTVDTISPVSTVQPLTPSQADSSFFIYMNGTDLHAGIQDYIIYAAENNNDFKRIFDGAPDSLWFHGTPGIQYAFFSQARDRAGNLEDTIHAADAITLITVGTEDLLAGVSFEVFPNPATTSVQVMIHTQLAKEAVITLYSIDGTRQRAWTIPTGGTNLLPLDRLSNGAYYLKASIAGKDILIKKIILLK